MRFSNTCLILSCAFSSIFSCFCSMLYSLHSSFLSCFSTCQLNIYLPFLPFPIVIVRFCHASSHVCQNATCLNSVVLGPAIFARTLQTIWYVCEGCCIKMEVFSCQSEWTLLLNTLLGFLLLGSCYTRKKERKKDCVC